MPSKVFDQTADNFHTVSVFLTQLVYKVTIESISAISNSTAAAPFSQTAPQPQQDAAKTTTDLSPEDQERVRELKERDAEVRRHEQAHMAAGGQYVTSGPTYSYKTGPDGQRYATGGEVGLDIAPIPDDPEATLEKAKVVKKAALAPEQPSGQDYRVAANADKMALKARGELAEQEASEPESSGYNQAGQATKAESAPRIFDFSV